MLTWLITNIIVALPTWFWIALSVTGAVLFYGSNLLGIVPAVRPYKVLLKVIGIAALVIGIFMTGGSGVTSVWKSEIDKAEAKVKAAEQQSRQVNQRLANELKTKNELIYTAQNLIRSQISVSAQRMDAQCKVDSEVVRIINEAAKGPAK